jgi:hypothetical protein
MYFRRVEVTADSTDLDNHIINPFITVTLNIYEMYIRIRYMKLSDITKYKKIGSYFPRSRLQRQRLQKHNNFGHEQNYYYDISKPPEIAHYIENRFLPLFMDYKRNARINTRRLRIWRISIIALTLFIIIFNVVAIGNSNYRNNSSVIAMGIVSSIAAALIVGFTAFLQLTKAQENWLLYGTISEKLERQYNLFKFKGGVYANRDKEGAVDGENEINRLFVENVENISLHKGQDLDRTILLLLLPILLLLIQGQLQQNHLQQ